MPISACIITSPSAVPASPPPPVLFCPSSSSRNSDHTPSLSGPTMTRSITSRARSASCSSHPRSCTDTSSGGSAKLSRTSATTDAVEVPWRRCLQARTQRCRARGRTEDHVVQEEHAPRDPRDRPAPRRQSGTVTRETPWALLPHSQGRLPTTPKRKLCLPSKVRCLSSHMIEISLLSTDKVRSDDPGSA
ncbi:hypothetical protein EDB92DRAFT_1345771 [Lactarius akahatsu]|uniref:Uncharacterized protein n=1 Tax=Lactarius akahatsu TaxID=416441 RepID=A0AAD4QAY0_9AGAM|nr:hypothetical protein EDB92DRAFT_1345771 [Lactarius akahatsu]